jgi:hypothetical protein
LRPWLARGQSFGNEPPKIDLKKFEKTSFFWLDPDVA